MAETRYPKVTAKAWITLRDRASSAPSTKFTASTVASLMNMSSSDSARSNTVAPMRKLGLFDEDGSLTDLGTRWRIDASYSDACQEIVESIYPGELSGLVGADGKPDLSEVRTWFEHKGFGGSNAQQMAATYVMIASGDLPDSSRARPTGNATTRKNTTKKKETAPAKDSVQASPAVIAKVAERAPDPSPLAPSGPTVHLDIQIHIPADASPEQIEQIFASMGKHLYQR